MTMLRPPARSQNRSPLGILGQNESRITFRNSGATLIPALLLARSRDCTHRQFCYDWDDYDILFYHAWQDVTIEPTHFIDWDFVRQLGLESDVKEMITELDAAHLTSTQWLKEGCYWSYVDEDSGHLLELPQQTVTEFDGDVTRLAFHLDPILHQNLAHHTRSSSRTALARRPRVHARSPSTAGPSRQPEDAAEDDTDED
ncbi:hypothetical protein HID58_060225 [Brassica napus]|uniref:Uncharacterized protein n=1 Tax=Brassica napus TaxID=3708 RepID=A0ABQ7ZV40_BRANA|nr:hypothetical protein HID58_060225 [Brassica napus]